MKIDIPKEPAIILHLLNNHGFDAYVVGGCVRDALLKRKPQDWDICTNARPEEIIHIFTSYSLKVLKTGIKHGTVTVLFHGKHFEITTYRIDGNYLDNRRPDKVIFTDYIKEDLSRRDFTINAMAYHPKKGLVDNFNGQSDLKKKIIKCVGEPKKRFEEDALRILRGIRFTAQLDFHLEETTKNAMYLKRKLIQNISKERIRDEIVKILLAHKPSNGILLLSDLHLLEFIIPEFKNIPKDLFNRILFLLDNTPKILEIRLSAFLFYINLFLNNPLTVNNILKNLKFDNKTINNVCLLIYESLYTPDFSSIKDIKKFMIRIGIKNLENFWALKIALIKESQAHSDFSNILNVKNTVEKILKEKHPLELKDLQITGNDLISLGIPQGKQVGILLEQLLDKVLENPNLNEKDQLLKIAKNYKPSIS
ncbi:CCA tRNA nucleotidyltransferase [Crassaminicella indica]|uniref:CCA tRNA nucleotidyltransferase n=1 Tax=Crassaminicella indica TaxID=2855394 RepID=A0ABX8RCZ7_9CLOT|nr:CCA tRNA nucleotidyltransferase [Crassaminicella indica]QXM06172.1 CCA tRNA nucleotidyltransferase [Crassaminicella indica]